MSAADLALNFAEKLKVQTDTTIHVNFKFNGNSDIKFSIRCCFRTTHYSRKTIALKNLSVLENFRLMTKRKSRGEWQKDRRNGSTLHIEFDRKALTYILKCTGSLALLKIKK